MHLNASELLQPVFDFLDGIIRDYGDILFMLFTYDAIDIGNDSHKKAKAHQRGDGA